MVMDKFGKVVFAARVYVHKVSAEIRAHDREMARRSIATKEAEKAAKAAKVKKHLDDLDKAYYEG